jgi:hypothetical protein
MALTTEETKTALVGAWDEVNALPGHAFGRRAIEKIVARHIDRAIIAKQGAWESPYPIKADSAAS